MKSLRSLVVLLAVGAIPALLSAQANSNSFNAGVAQLSGKINLVAGAAQADFDLASANNGALQTKMSFKSKRVVVENDHVEIIGDLTLTTLERDADYNPGEDYAGARYSKAAEHNVTREVVFAFPRKELAQKNAKGRISASAMIGRENFPGLIPAIYAAHWAPLIENEQCLMPPNASEDYAGPACTGTLVETANAAYVLANVSEDYRGQEVKAPAGNMVKIVLNLQMSGDGSVGTASFFIG